MYKFIKNKIVQSSIIFNSMHLNKKPAFKKLKAGSIKNLFKKLFKFIQYLLQFHHDKKSLILSPLPQR